MLALDERLHERMLARVRARDELMDERLLVEQRDDCAQRRVESALMLEIGGHGRVRGAVLIASALVYSPQQQALHAARSFRVVADDARLQRKRSVRPSPSKSATSMSKPLPSADGGSTVSGGPRVKRAVPSLSSTR